MLLSGFKLLFFFLLIIPNLVICFKDTKEGVGDNFLFFDTKDPILDNQYPIYKWKWIVDNSEKQKRNEENFGEFSRRKKIKIQEEQSLYESVFKKESHCECTAPIGNRIVGKRETTELNWMAIVSSSNLNFKGLRNGEKEKLIRKDYLCSAFVLNERWVMTTRKCTQDESREYKVSVGNDKIEMFNERIKVISIIHKDDKVDISLLKLDRPINLNRFKPVCLDVIGKYEQPTVKKFFGAGFGKISPQKQNLSSEEIVSSISGKHNIESGYTRQIELIEDFKETCNTSNLCVKSAIKKRGDRSEKALCFGDQGGPLYYLLGGKAFIVGLLIDIIPYKEENGFSYFCGGEGKATYLKIAPHISWIKEHLGEDNYCDNK